MPQRILGIDLGSWSVKSVLLEDSFRGFQVVGVSEVKIPEGPAETKSERQGEALRELMNALTERADAQIAALSGEQAVIRFVTMPFSDQKKVQQTIGGELADSVPFELSDAVFDHAILKKAESSSLTLAAVVRKSEVAATLGRLQASGIDPKFLSIDVLQLYNLYTHFLRSDSSKAEVPQTSSADAGTFIAAAPGGPPEGRLLLDVGHERTLVLAAGEDGIAYARVIRCGGADITRAMIESLKLEAAQAEALKHQDGFVASTRHPAPTEDAQAISEAVVQGLAPLVRELRRTLQTIRSEKRIRVARIDVLGGGSRIRNLPNYLAEELNVPVAQGLAVEQIIERFVDSSRRSAYSVALALGLRAVGDEPVSTIDLRQEEFQFAGQLRHARQHVPLMAASAAVMAILLAVNVWASYFTVIRRERAVDQQFCAITKTAIGREICEPKQAISVMMQPAGELGNVRLPARSALNIAAELSARIPEGLDVHVDEMDINPERARISGETTTYDAVDQIVAEYSKDSCYKDIKKGKLGKKAGSDRIEFQLTVQLECK